MKTGLRVVMLFALLLLAVGVAFVETDTVWAEEERGGRIEVEKQVKVDGGEWQDADNLWDALKIPEGTQVFWRIEVENDSQQPVTFSLVDKMDDSVVDLSTYCPGSDSVELEADKEYVCEFDSVAGEGPHINIAAVTFTREGQQMTKHDAAFYIGTPPDSDDDLAIEVEKKVKVDGGEWKDADRLWDALKVQPQDILIWQIEIENKSGKTVKISISDMMDGKPYDVSAECLRPENGELADGFSYACEFQSTAEEGAHINVAEVNIESEGEKTVKRDAAVYIGRVKDDDDDDDEIDIDVEKKVKVDDGEWKDADSLREAPVIQPGDPFSWLILVKNDSDKAVTLSIADKLDGEIVDLASCPEIPVPFEPGEEYACELPSIAEAGLHINVAIVTVEVDGKQIVERDAAMYVGVPKPDEDYARISVEKKVKIEGGEWKDADKLRDALKTRAATDLFWFIQVVNNSGKTIRLTVADKMDGADYALPAECQAPTSGELADGEYFECEFKTVAQAGAHVNVVLVTAEFDGKQIAKRDAAYYIGMPEPDDNDDDEGCGQGYWKTHLLAWNDTEYIPSDLYDDVFGVESTFEATTLIGVLWQRGGGEMALGRQAVAALLSASHPDVAYPYSVAEVVAAVQEAYADGTFELVKDKLEKMNDYTCPLGRGDDWSPPGAGTVAFWRHNGKIWPLSSLFVGHHQYSQQQALAFMNQAGADQSSVGAAAVADKTVDLFSEVAASRLNVAVGNDASCIDATLDAADEWLAVNSVGSGVSETDAAWQEAAALYQTLVEYNEGQLCAPALTEDSRPGLFLPFIR